MMKNFKYIWVIGLIVTALIIAVPVVVTLAKNNTEPERGDPWAGVPVRAGHTDHTELLQGPFTTGQEVTSACLECHADAAHEVMQTTHWTWQAPPVEVAWSDEPVSTGKANLMNNFCIGIQSNWPACTSCHAGYGWEDAGFDFTDQTAVDCLVCHDQSGLYTKTTAGYPTEGVELLAAAQSVGTPSRQNCGSCHFYGGGGDMVKHGDLDSTLTNPPADLDIHMGSLGFLCVDCHQTEDHQIGGRSISVSVDAANQIACTDCHTGAIHPDDRLNAHLDTVACQTCHIPEFARRLPTKIVWDWSTAGQDIPEDVHEYLKIKGTFIYEAEVQPAYAWYNGDVAYRYLMGDAIVAEGTTLINPPAGDITDPDALIWPFKVHQAIQPYDLVYGYLLQPQTAGEGGFWDAFNWDQAFRLGAEATGLAYSGEYDWAHTEMYWPITHMVAPAGDALTCSECHGESGRLDWEALGYHGDPIDWGGRTTTGR
jgi:octaheme c-type cytochrome (tetrathionate reductase family)